MCIFIVLIFSFFQCIAMQKSTEIHKQWLTPFIGYYQLIKWPTYVTDKIYFTSTKSLSGSHYIDNNSLTINETNISLNNKSPNKNIKKKNFFQNNYNSESLPVTIVKQDNSDIYIRINNENFIINTHYKTIDQSSEERIVSSEETILSSEDCLLPLDWIMAYI